MNKIYLIYCIGVSQLFSAVTLYEGFDSKESETGWLTGWHRLAGEVGTSELDLSLQGLESSGGALDLTKKGEAIAQHNISMPSHYYGSFRVQAKELKNDTVLGLLLSRPMNSELGPKTATLSFLAKGWRSEFGTLLVGGRPIKVTEGFPIQAGKTYLIAFQITNTADNQSIRMWILNEDQAEHYGEKRKFKYRILNKAPLSQSAEGVMQRVHYQSDKKQAIQLRSGDVVACISKFCPKALFDEIKLSELSLNDAVGVKAPK